MHLYAKLWQVNYSTWLMADILEESEALTEPSGAKSKGNHTHQDCRPGPFSRADTGAGPRGPASQSRASSLDHSFQQTLAGHLSAGD